MFSIHRYSVPNYLTSLRLFAFWGKGPLKNHLCLLHVLAIGVWWVFVQWMNSVKQGIILKMNLVVLEISVSFRKPLCFDGKLHPDDTQNGASDGSLQGLKSWISVSRNPDLLLVSHHWIMSHQHRNEQTNKNSLRTDPTVNVLSLGTFSSQIPVASQVSHSFSFLLRLFPGSFLVLLKINHTEKVLQSNKVVCREHKNFFFLKCFNTRIFQHDWFVSDKGWREQLLWSHSGRGLCWRVLKKVLFLQKIIFREQTFGLLYSLRYSCNLE